MRQGASSRRTGHTRGLRKAARPSAPVRRDRRGLGLFPQPAARPDISRSWGVRRSRRQGIGGTLERPQPGDLRDDRAGRVGRRVIRRQICPDAGARQGDGRFSEGPSTSIRERWRRDRDGAGRASPGRRPFARRRERHLPQVRARPTTSPASSPAVRGHGLGLSCDSKPSILGDVHTVLEEGMTIIVHPNTYNPRRLRRLGDSVDRDRDRRRGPQHDAARVVEDADISPLTKPAFPAKGRGPIRRWAEGG